MKILITTNDFPPDIGGMEEYSYRMALNLQKYFEVIVVCGNERKRQNIENIKIKEFNIKAKRNIFRVLKWYKILKQIIEETKIDLVFCTTWSPMAIACYLCKIPYIVAAHGRDVIEPVNSLFYSNLMYFILNKAKKVLPVSHWTKNILLIQGIKKENIEIVEDGVDIDEFKILEEEINQIKEKYNLEYRSNIFFTCGRLVKHKNHIAGIKAYKRYLEKTKDYKSIFLIAGEGEEYNNLNDFIKQNNLLENVKLLGKIIRKDLIGLYNLSKLFFMTSIEIEKKEVEGFGIVTLEAFAAHTPVIGFLSGGTAELIKNGYNGYLIEKNNIDDFSEKIETVTEKNNYEKLCNNAYETALKFTWQKSAGKLKNIIEKIK